MRMWMMIAGLAMIATLCAAFAAAQDDTWRSEPEAEHEWLQRFVGTWDIEVTANMGEGMAPMEATGVERVRMLGELWVIAESEYPGMSGSSMLTLGYSPEQSRYVGSWVDSFNPFQWVYTGEVNEAGTALTLRATGPKAPGGPVVEFRETIEFKSDDHKVMTSEMQEDDGEWVTIVTVDYRRRAEGATR